MKKLFIYCLIGLGLGACGGPTCHDHQENANAPIFFEHNSVKMLPHSSAQLDDGLVYMTGHRFKKIELNGYADETGKSEAYNMDLSKRRVETIRDYLVKHGVSATRITGYWHGTERGKPYQSHRRVDITIK